MHIVNGYNSWWSSFCTNLSSCYSGVESLGEEIKSNGRHWWWGIQTGRLQLSVVPSSFCSEHLNLQEIWRLCTMTFWSGGSFVLFFYRTSCRNTIVKCYIRTQKLQKESNVKDGCTTSTRIIGTPFVLFKWLPKERWKRIVFVIYSFVFHFWEESGSLLYCSFL